MNYPAAELRGIKMNFYLINPDAEHRGILLINSLNRHIGKLCNLISLTMYLGHNKFSTILCGLKATLFSIDTLTPFQKAG